METSWWYVLFVKSNTENRVIADITRAFVARDTNYQLEAFFFKTEKYYRSKKAKMLAQKYSKRPLFPGYVFLETNMPANDFLGEFSNYIRDAADIIKILKSGEDNIALPIEERRKLEFLYRGKRCLEHSVGYIIGDNVVITAGPLIGREGLIKHINRHNRDALIEIDMFGRKLSVKVALEIVSKQ